MRQSLRLILILCLCWCALSYADLCRSHSQNRTSCLAASPSCVYSNFSGVCCTDHGPYTCPDLEQGDLLQNGGVYVAQVFIFWLGFNCLSFSALALSQSPFRTEILVFSSD